MRRWYRTPLYLSSDAHGDADIPALPADRFLKNSRWFPLYRLRVMAKLGASVYTLPLPFSMAEPLRLMAGYRGGWRQPRWIIVTAGHGARRTFAGYRFSAASLPFQATAEPVTASDKARAFPTSYLYTAFLAPAGLTCWRNQFCCIARRRARADGQDGRAHLSLCLSI